MKAVPGDIYKFYCIPCSKKLSCDHQGVKDVIDHCKKESHKNCVEASKKQSSMKSFLKNETPPLDKQFINDEVMITNFLIQHNSPFATSDHLSFLFKEVFPDNEIAKNYAARRAKTGAIINELFGPDSRNYIVEHCKTHPFSFGTDRSNDTGLQKMNPVCLKNV